MPVIDVAAGLVFRQARLLVAQRFPDSHLGGLWEFPGGKVEPGETFDICLRRELHEELGIEVAVGDEVDSVRHSYPEKTVQLRFFRCQWLRGEPVAHGCQAFAWITREQLGNYSFPPADELLLSRLAGASDWWL